MGNAQVYAQRMESNVDDKLAIFDFIESKEGKYNILDFGCGSGSILKHLNMFCPNSTYVGFDRSEFMIQRAKSNYPNNIFLSKFEELDNFIENNGLFDYAIFNSLLHEIYSYGDGFATVVELFNNLSKYFKNSVKIIVRDGLLDTESVDDINQVESYKLRYAGEAKAFLEEYTYLSPFPNHLRIEGDNIIGVWHEVREFLNKYTWGFESLYREAREIVNFASIDTYHKLFDKAGYVINNQKLLKQEEYFTYLDKIVDIGDKRWNTKIVFSATRKL